jgi:hypothetical protein
VRVENKQVVQPGHDALDGGSALKLCDEVAACASAPLLIAFVPLISLIVTHFSLRRLPRAKHTAIRISEVNLTPRCGDEQRPAVCIDHQANWVA